MSENHTFVLQQVIDDLLNCNNSLESPLLKLNYFARLIKNEELIQYTNLEINGYKGTELPSYRKTVATLNVKLQAWHNFHVKELPISMLDKPLIEKLSFFDIHDGIKVLENTALKAHKNESPLLISELPMELLAFLQPAAAKLYKTDVELQVISAWISANSNIIIQILSTVRSKLLAFTMEIADHFGYNIEISSFKKQEISNNNTINNFIRTEIINNGNGNINNTGDDTNLVAEITLKSGKKE
ncbi:hypothetical protein [Pedobacter sp. L105]|uniref:AbiTii domain-containing protein n=1 Tax=Pedobacter sp. L105 TaxID=1641871 RepID=UPI00131ACCE4|nr:hypothetical protein [Pedobacter sp. L105]